MSGDRGGKVLVSDGYRYTWYRDQGGRHVWRCWRRGACQAKLITNGFDRQIENPDIRVIHADEHGHPPDTDRVDRAVFRQEMEDEASQDPTRPSRRLYNAAIGRAHRQAMQGGGDRPELPSFRSVRAVVERRRRSVLPPLPQEVEDVKIMEPWDSTWNNERYLLAADNDWGYAIFATDNCIQTLRTCRTVYIDGTFRTCPRPYTQVLTILGDVHGHVVPLVHALMHTRGVGSYRQVFQRVKAKVRQLTHHRWSPRVVVCDFEQALRSAIQTELPACRIAGCYFHFKQNLWKRVQEYGLTVPFRDNPMVKRLVRKLMSLGHLPLALVRINFNILCNAQATRELVNDFPGLHDLINYVRNTYMNAQGSFPPAVWNVYGRRMEQRTNNNAESKLFFFQFY